VTVVFQVDTSGRVVDPRVAKSTDPAFDRAALEAVRQWRFEPGTRDGEPVQFKMKIPITFNAT
jgi:protein TonB